MNEWYLCNVVWYDGAEAYVGKFVLRANDSGITKESEIRLRDHLAGLGELLKVDILYAVNFDDILHLERYDGLEKTAREMKAAFERFKGMWF